jgi:hypothetical protein
MTTHEQISHAMDIKARIEDYMVELDNMREDISPCQVVNRLTSIFARAEDANFELRCRECDFSI